MKILVTGAAGFLGKHVCLSFASSENEIVGIGRGVFQDVFPSQFGLQEWLSSDVTYEKLLTLNFIPEAIIHCAGGSSVGFSVKNPEEDKIRTIESLKEVLKFAAEKAPNAKLVYPSSASVYGAVDRLPIAETHPLNPVSPYGKHKKQAEEMILEHAKKNNLQASIIRFFSIYGPGLQKQLLWDACQKFQNEEPVFLGTGNETRDWLHVKDAVALIKVALNHASSIVPIVNGGAGQAISVETIVSKIATHFDNKGYHFTGTRPVGDPFQFQADLTRITRWNWKPEVSLEDGLHEYIGWFLKKEMT